MPSKNYTGKRVAHDMTLAERLEFYSEADPSGCRLWQGTFRDGYGRLRFKTIKRNAHVWAWEVKNGPVPAGLQVLHRCDVRACINTDHLFLGTNADNVADKVSKGRQARGERHGAILRARAALQPYHQRGEDRPAAKLTRDQIIKIRADGRPQVDIARAYGVSQALISMIKLRKAWTHI